MTAAYTGEIALADDTSLQVRELNGWPDVFAARFSGEGATYESNARLVVDLMEDVPDGSRQARFAVFPRNITAFGSFSGIASTAPPLVS